jgi:hypothetical protein
MSFPNPFFLGVRGHFPRPYNLSSALHRVAEVETRRRLTLSADTDILLIRRLRLITVGDRRLQPLGRGDGTAYHRDAAYSTVRHLSGSLNLFSARVIILNSSISHLSQWSLPFFQLKPL